ncbi:MAG: DAK2 domain-containing protein [Bilifractor sp.]
MAADHIDAALLSRMFMAGAQNLSDNKDIINELNVFPVPDGDTGTNMTLTIMSAVHEIQAQTNPDMKSLCKCISSGSLRGARGNSGVILSQLLRGFTKVVKGSDSIDIPMIADGMEKAVETAYKAVIKPKEGTILTVAKGMAEISRKLVDAQMPLEEYLKNIIDYGNEVLQKTPEMLPVLKEAGVVDSGGKGLMTVMEGCFDAFIGKEIRLTITEDTAKNQAEEETPVQPKLRFGYCEEFQIHMDRPVSEAVLDEFRSFLGTSGECPVVVSEGKTIKVYVRTGDPGMILTKAMSFGSLSHIQVTNLSMEKHSNRLIRDPEKVLKEQQEERAAQQAPMKEMGFVVVSCGEGFDEIFKGLGADCIVSGGQTMNPSTEDLIGAIDKVNARTVFIFPNNKNIIMAARQVKELVQEKSIIIIETKTVPQGISALLALEPDRSPVDNQATMNEAVSAVKTAEITYAVRDTTIDQVEIHQGDIMAVGDNGLLAVSKDIREAAMQAVDRMLTDDSELVSIYFGKEYSEENANRIARDIQEKHPDIDVAVENGGQPVYYCIISVE